MLCVYGSPLYQWDINRQLKIDSVDIHSDFKIHCCHKEDSSALVVEPIFDGDSILVNIPNILLQRSGFLRVYVVIEGDTVFDASFYVMARPKPDDYVYTETEVWTVESAVEDALQEAKESGEFDGKDGYTPIKGVDYFTDEDKQEIADLIPVKDGGNGSVIANDLEENKTNIAHSFIGGKDNDATLKGFKITGVDSSGGLWLDSVEGLTEGTLVAYFKETDKGVVRYRDKVVSIGGGICPECAKGYNVEGKYLMPFAIPKIDGSDDDTAWEKAQFVGSPTVTTWRGVPTDNWAFNNATLKITHDENTVYILLTASLNSVRGSTSDVDITIRTPNDGRTIKAHFFQDYFEKSMSNISSASIKKLWLGDYDYRYELAIPCDNLPKNAEDIFVNVACYFSDGNTGVDFNWGGKPVEWGADPVMDEAKALKTVVVPPCSHGELVMFEDQIKTSIVNGNFVFVNAEDAYYANGAFLIARATDKSKDDIGTAAYFDRTTIGSTVLTTKFGDPVTAFVGGRNNLVSIDATCFGDGNDSLGYQAVTFGRYNRNYADRGAIFGYMNWLLGHEGFIAGVKNTGTGYACFIGGGESNESLGDYSHSSGFDTKVTQQAKAGRASGIGTISNAEAQDASGMYNEFDEEGKYLCIVGNGTSREDRSNAHTLDKQGNAWFAGGVILTAPNGARFKVTVTNSGTLKVATTTD